MADKPFLTDIKTLRERARQHIENGAVTEGYRADRETAVKLLNEALATEIRQLQGEINEASERAARSIESQQRR